MKRVCMIVMSRYPEDERVRREAAALERAGVAVDVICWGAAGQPPVEQFGLVTAYRIAQESNKENIRQYLWVSLRFTLAAFLKLQRLSLAHPYGVIQAHNMPDFLAFTGILQKMRGTPIVLDLHDLSVELYKSKWNGSRGRVILPLVRAAEKASCALASRVITTSPGFMNRLTSRGQSSQKLELVLNTPDPRFFKYQEGRVFGPASDGVRLLYHGTVARRFGLAEAIDAVARLRGRIPKLQFNIYGKYDASYRRQLEEQIDRLELKDIVKLGGWCDLARIQELIREADIGIVPYLKDEFMNLAASTKSFEYAATGLPLAVSRLDPAAAYFSSDAVEFFEPGDPADMAEKIATLAGDPQRRCAHAAAARAALDKIAWPVMEARYVNLMRRLMGANGTCD